MSVQVCYLVLVQFSFSHFQSCVKDSLIRCRRVAVVCFERDRGKAEGDMIDGLSREQKYIQTAAADSRKARWRVPPGVARCSKDNQAQLHGPPRP